MTEQELLELCSLGESTTVQYKLEFTTQKRILDYLKDYLFKVDKKQNPII